MSAQERIKRLGDAELEIMLALWEQEEPVTSGHILERIRSKRSWALSTLMASLERLAAKGFVHCDRSTRTNYYTALISAEQYRSSESRDFIDRLFDSSVTRLVANLYDSRAIDRSDLDELRSLLDRLEEVD